MDAFYASVEQRDNPAYQGKPIGVGGLPEGRGGVIATASYEARAFGVHSAMPSKMALLLCPDLIIIRPRFGVYQEISGQIREIFARYTDLIEPLSLDEAYLDVTADKRGIGSAIEIARQIKKAISTELHLTASAGISVNKFVAKTASSLNKPDGLTFIAPSRVEAFMEGLPVEQFFGVGKVTAGKMKGLNLHTGADLKKLSEEALVYHFGKAGRFYYRIARGIDDRKVENDRPVKSLSAEDTFPHDLTSIGEMDDALEKIAGILFRRMQNQGLNGRTVTLKIRYSDFRQVTRSRSAIQPLQDLHSIVTTARQLLLSSEPENKKIRLLGITVSQFMEHSSAKKNTPLTGQLKLF